MIEVTVIIEISIAEAEIIATTEKIVIIDIISDQIHDIQIVVTQDKIHHSVETITNIIITIKITINIVDKDTIAETQMVIIDLRIEKDQIVATTDIRQMLMIEITALSHQTENKITDTLQEIETMRETIMITAIKTE